MTDVPPGAVCVPCTEQMWSRSAIALISVANELPGGSAVWGFPTNTMLATKRNRGARQMLDKADHRWVLYLDSDMTPPPDVAQRLWRTAEESDADLVQATMVQRTPPYLVVGARAQSRGVPEDPLAPATSDPDMQYAMFAAEGIRNAEEPIEMDMAGTGCLLIRREVFEKLDEPWFVGRDTGGAEDYNMTLRATDAGFKLVLDPTVEVGHVSAYALTIEDAVRHQQSAFGDLAERAGALMEAES